MKGKTAPGFELETLDGKKMRLADLKGKAVLLNFWATWCDPCKIEMPWFVELQNQYGPQGLAIIGIAMDDSSNEAIAKFTKEMGVNTWAAFAGTDDNAMVDGDFAVLEGELQPVLKSLRAENVNIVAIHSHMTQEKPRILFLHYWGKGTAADLAGKLKKALVAQKAAK